MTIKEKIVESLTEKQRQTPKQLSVALDTDQMLVTESINQLLETGVLTKHVAGNKRTLLTTEYVIANKILIKDYYIYKEKRLVKDNPTPTLDGQMLFNRLAFN